jgi:hypothetical protein
MIVKILAVVGAVLLSIPPLLLVVTFWQLIPLSSILIALAMVAGAWLWWFLRKRAKGVAFSESALMGRQKSTEGLL